MVEKRRVVQRDRSVMMYDGNYGGNDRRDWSVVHDRRYRNDRRVMHERSSWRKQKWSHVMDRRLWKKRHVNSRNVMN